MGIDCTIHMDPIAANDKQCSILRQRLSEVMESVGLDYPIHDFRTVIGASHTNLIFDIVVPFDIHLTEDEIKRKISEAVIEKYPVTW